MPQSTSPELQWLALSAGWCALLWLPYVANRFKELGPPGWAWFPPADPPPRAPWAQRAWRAHLNAVENLVVFAPLVLAVVLAGRQDAGTALAAQLYFWARVGHYAVSIAGLPIVPRTLCFLLGLGAQLWLAGRLIQPG